MRAAWLRGSLVLALVLLSGIALGIAIERARATGGADHAMDPVVLMRALDRELVLDSAQRTAIAAVLVHRQGAIDSAWRGVRPAMRAAIDSSQMEIVNILRPEQRARFLELVRSAHPGMR